jgi:hypothetical protein
MPRETPEELRQLACWQEGILTSGQAQRGGLTGDTIRSRVRQGRWQRIHLGVYATFSGQPSRLAILWAAVLRAGEGAVLSYDTAAELYGLADQQSEPIHLTLPGGRRIARIPGTVLHLSERAGPARHPALAPPRTRLEETVLDLANSAANLDASYGWITQAVGRRLTTPRRLRAAMDERSRLRWRDELAEVLTADLAGIHSVLEYRYERDVERRHALPRGVRQARTKLRGRTEYRDVLYEEYAVAVELDGRTAHPGDTRWRDIRRDNAAATENVLTLRYGWLDVRQQPCLTAAEVTHVLRGRGYRGGQACSLACPVPPPPPLPPVALR